MTPNRRCDTCSASHEDGPALYCKFNPPQVTILALPARNLAGEVVPQFQTLAAQPVVKPDGWCMKWAPLLKFTQ
jgi:hypothetical protein